MIKTTFIIPSCGRDTLKRALDSVNKLTNAEDCVVSYKIDEERQGASAVRNELIQKADTEWVSFLDDDDTVTSDYVERLKEEVEAHPEADMVIFREYFIQDKMGDDNPYPDHFIWQVPAVHWGQIGIAFSVKRDVAIKFPFIEEDNEDFHFVKRIEQAGYKIHFSKYITYRARH